MTSREARRERREAERKTAKLAYKAGKAAASAIGFVSQPEEKEEPAADSGFVPQSAAPSTKRAEINRANAQYSTGPRSKEGKMASSRNSLKHGLASGEIIIPGEDQAALETLRRDLLEEHRPADRTEELLVTEMAQSWWLTQRAIRLQNQCFDENGGVDEKRLSLFLRYQTTHQRAFHKALNTLTCLKQNRVRQQAVGFVSHTAQNSEPSDGFSGFFSQNRPPEPPNQEANQEINQEVNTSKAA